MDNDRQINAHYNTIRMHRNQISNLEDDISALQEKLQLLYEDQAKYSKMIDLFHKNVEYEKQNLTKVGQITRIRMAMGYSQDMLDALTGSRYNFATNGIEEIRMSIDREIEETEQEIRQKENSVSDLQQQIQSLKRRIDRLGRE